jgi:hypothetical protein
MSLRCYLGLRSHRENQAALLAARRQSHALWELAFRPVALDTVVGGSAVVAPIYFEGAPIRKLNSEESYTRASEAETGATFDQRLESPCLYMGTSSLCSMTCVCCPVADSMMY